MRVCFAFPALTSHSMALVVTANRRAVKQNDAANLGPQQKGFKGRKERNFGAGKGRRTEAKTEDPRASMEGDLSVVVGRTGKAGNVLVTSRWTEGLHAAGLGEAVTEIVDRGKGPVTVRVSGTCSYYQFLYAATRSPVLTLGILLQAGRGQYPLLHVGSHSR